MSCVRFRSDWPVERVGKWREPDYTAPIYPSFACGAGNVLSADLVKWLALNADHLKSYQVNANIPMLLLNGQGNLTLIITEFCYFLPGRRCIDGNMAFSCSASPR